MDSRGAAPLCAGWGSGVRDNHLGIVLQFIETAVGHHVSGIDSFHLRDPAVGNSRLDAAHVSDIVLNYIHKRRLAILLDGGRLKERHSLQRVYKQMCVYELVREKSAVLVVKLRPPFYRSRRRVNLV